MRSLLISVALVACHTAPAPVAQVVGSRGLDRGSLSLIPSDTPYVFVSLEAIKPATRVKMFGIRNQDLLGALDKSDATTAGGKVMHAVAAELRDGDRVRELAELGFAASPRFAFYGLSVWPVLRVEVADATHVRAVAARVLGAAGGAVSETLFEGHPYWSAGTPDVQVVAIVLDREAVIALVPTTMLQQSLPYLFGSTRPAHSIAETDRLGETARSYGFVNTWFGYIDIKQLAAIASGHATGLTSDLAAPLRTALRSVASCMQDVEWIASAMPRVLFGYRRLDEQGFAGGLYLETPATITRSLASLRVGIPGVTTTVPTQPLAQLGVAANVEEAIAFAGQVIEKIEAHRFGCPALGPLTEAAHEVGAVLDRGLPPLAQGLRGASIVLDDLVPEPPNGTGHVIVVGDHVDTLVSLLLTTLFAGAVAPPLGVPLDLPLAQLQANGLGIASAHLVVSGDRAALAVGPDSEKRVLRAAALAAPAHSPFFAFTYDIQRLRALFPKSDALASSRLDGFRRFTMFLDVDQHGPYVGFDGTWR